MASSRAPSVLEAAQAGDEMGLLVALRDRIASALSEDDCPKREMASLSLRLTNIVKDIKALESAEGGDDIGAATSTPDAAFSAEAL